MSPVLLMLLLAFLMTAPAGAERVWYVHDGDTLRLTNGQKVRLEGIDAPELHQPFGVVARNRLADMVMGQDIQLRCDAVTYDRLACQVFVRGQDIAWLMVQYGLAFDYTHYSHGKYLPAEGFARQYHLGVWTMPGGGERPWNFRHYR